MPATVPKPLAGIAGYVGVGGRPRPGRAADYAQQRDHYRGRATDSLPAGTKGET